MDAQAYADEISSWIDPFRVFSLFDELRADPSAGDQPVEIVLESGLLKSGRDGNLASLVSLYLDHFRVPPILLEFLAPALSDDELQWLSAVRFEGEVIVDPDREPLEMTPVLAVRDRESVIEIVRGPIAMLLDVVNLYARTWAKLRPDDAGAPEYFLLHSSSGRLPVFIERLVAEAHGFTNVGSSGIAYGTGIKTSFRSVTVAGWATSLDSAVIEAARQTARRQAV